MAWTEKQPGGGYVGRWRDSAGRKHRTEVYDRKTDAREAAQEEEVKARRQAARKKGKLSARTPWGQWWDLLAAKRDFDSDTADAEASIVEHYLKPKWGETPLNEIERANVQAWADSLSAGTCEQWTHARRPQPSYVRRIVGVFAMSVNAAVNEEILTASPCTKLKLPRITRKSKPWMPMDDAEELTGDKGQLRDDYADAVDLDMELGLRPGELCGLHIHRINRKRRVITIAETLVQRKMVIRPIPKDRDIREVPITDRAMEIIDRHLESRELNGCGLEHTDGSACESDVLIRTKWGRIMRPDSLRKAMHGAAERAKLPKRGGYALRRGMITRAIDGGADIFTVQRITGHADLDELAGYVQDSPAARARLLAALGQAQPLQAVTGHDGAEDGADSDSEALPDTQGKGDQNAV